LDIRWALPEEASPPVSDTLNPILMGSPVCARQIARPCLQGALHPSTVHGILPRQVPVLLADRDHVGRDDSTGLTNTRKPNARLARRLALEPRSRPPREPIAMLIVLIRDGAQPAD
jgi:hypothetical protein